MIVFSFYFVVKKGGGEKKCTLLDGNDFERCNSAETWDMGINCD